jgi:hypothetical protein
MMVSNDERGCFRLERQPQNRKPTVSLEIVANLPTTESNLNTGV